MSVSALRIFESISLGPHQEHIRKMLLNDDAGEPDQYGFYAVIPVIEGEFFADLISEPDVIRFQNQRLYRVVIGGILYMFTVSKQPPPRPDLFIQKNGDWIFQYRDVRNVEFLRQGLEGVRKVKHPQ
jgi:hypothetical protein